MNVTFRKSFARDLKKIKGQTMLDQVREVIERADVANSPTELGDLKKMAGTKDCYRIRIGDYRIGVVIDGSDVEFVRCLNRRDLYRYFP